MLSPAPSSSTPAAAGSVDDAALVEALKSGHIRAAGLDVYDGEPKVFEGYFGLENVALLPHLGSATEETRDAWATARSRTWTPCWCMGRSRPTGWREARRLV
jgi:hypothetical protein